MQLNGRHVAKSMMKRKSVIKYRLLA